MAARMGGSVVLVILVATATFATAQDTSVCTQVQPSDKTNISKPILPNQFEVHVEANIENRKYSVDYHLFFDKPNNRAAAHVNFNGTKYDEVFSFDTNELFTIFRTNTPGTCTVQPLQTANNLFLFGSLLSNGSVVMNNGSQTFHFGGQFAEQYIQNTTIRGIQCNLWRSCRYWPRLNSTMTVDFYFTTDNWLTSTENLAVPVRAQVYGRTWTKGVPHDFNHTYEFSDFSSTLKRLTVFETPTGVYCPQRKVTKPLPTPASAFHFTSEILFPDYKKIAFIKEYYDYDLGLVRYDRTPVENTPYGMNPLKTIHDFNTGVSYHIDDIRGNCTATKIANDTFDVRTSDPTHVRIRTSKEFYYFDKTSYTYEGTRAVRGMLADVWIAQRSDWPTPSAGINSTWEWYFLASDYTANIPDTLKFGMPIRMTVTAGIFANSIYNIYDYDERRPDIWSFDISSCFNYTQRRDFSFLLPGSFRDMASSNIEQFKYAVLRGITKAGSGPNTLPLSALRISNIRIDYADNNDIIVKFTLLDKPPPIGDVKSPQIGQDLNTVASSISSAINNGQFVVMMKLGTNAVTMKAKPYSLTPTKHVVQRAYYQGQTSITITTGTSGGVMAGMAVALLVVFFIVGVAATYMFYRRRGGAFLPKKFDNADITQDTS